MSDQPTIPATLDRLTERMQTQERQIATLTTILMAARPTRSERAGRARGLGVGSVIGLIFALLLGAVALAAIPGAGGVITGCYDKDSGKLRVIDAQAGKTCSRSEAQITWNQTGPQGLPGVAGPKGDAGAQGLKGDTGAQGPAGLTWRGEFEPGTTYQPGDAVYSGGASFIATQTTSDTPGPRIDLGIPWGILSLRGAAGPQGISGYVEAQAKTPLDLIPSKELFIPCPDGKRIITGGAYMFGYDLNYERTDTPSITLIANYPIPGGSAWHVRAAEILPYEGYEWQIVGYAICANVVP